MKKITKETILRKGHKTFQSVEVNDVVYWGKKSNEDWFNLIVDDEYWYIVAQSQPKLEGVPVISLDSYVERLKKGISEFSKLATDTQEQFWTGKAAGFGEALQIYNKSNPNQYTQQDIEKAYKMGYEDRDKDIGYGSNLAYCKEQINSISVIEVDEQFNIISYE